MSRLLYTAEMLDFLRDGYARMECCDLTDAFNARFCMRKTQGQIKSSLQNHGIKARRKDPMRGKRLSFTGEQIRWLKDTYRLMPLADLSAAFRARFGVEKTQWQIRAFLHNHAIRSGRTGCFNTGTEPWNKGMKGLSLGGRETWFSQGHIPANIKPLYSERVDRDGYIEIKITEQNPYTGAPTRFKHKHVWLWEQAHGSKPVGHMIIFMDGNNRNFENSNLRLISQAENLYLNSNSLTLGGLPPDARESALALAKLETKAHQIKKEMLKS